ncbi:hypothetical protein SKAU_G00251960 [Synaphobranchus kaupii]|uniref:Uncharacterized protein n=1 Tax=Synaphobranchus kaupii TaxID=118154 RepID=A0A9Q1F382_SYNKA|nr:hypothetical protein SKAU_G00251960 [Synaphobranchus kaupii]
MKVTERARAVMLKDERAVGAAGSSLSGVNIHMSISDNPFGGIHFQVCNGELRSKWKCLESKCPNQWIT